MTIYERIKFLREKRGMSQQELALKVGYKDKSAVSKVERGERDITQTMVARYAAALGTTPSYLMGGDDEPKKENPPLPDGLTEDERFWVDIYRNVSPEIQDLLIKMVSSFDQQSEEARQMLLRLIRAALGDQA